MFTIPIIIIVLTVVLLFEPYRTDEERWTTRERSYGYPFYWRMQYDESELKNHSKLYNRPYKIERTVKNVIYVE